MNLKRWRVMLVAVVAVIAPSAWYAAKPRYPLRIVEYPGHFCWAKNSSAVFYVMRRPLGICRYDLKRRTTETYAVPSDVAPEGNSLVYIDVSPNGRVVIFTVQDSGSGSGDHADRCILYSFDRGTRRFTRIPASPDISDIAWLNNNRIAFGVNAYVNRRFVHETWMMRPDGSGARRVASGETLDRVTDGSAFVGWDLVGKRTIYDLNGKRIRYWPARKEDPWHDDRLVYASAKWCVLLAGGGPGLVPSPCMDNRTGIIMKVPVPPQEVKLSPDGVWALYRSRAGTFDTYGPPTKPKLYITPLPEKTRKALQAP